MRNARCRLWIALIALNLMSFIQVAGAATVTLSTSPLANATASVVRPNIMYVLDNSGSMEWDYLPDYVSNGSGGTGSQICWSGTSDSGTRATCDSGGTDSPLSGDDMNGSSVQIPLLTSNINFLYYNPATYYQPPFKADGSNYDNSAASNAAWDGFLGVTTVTRNGSASSGSTSVTGLSSTSELVGMTVSGTGIPLDAVVTGRTSSSITINMPTTAAFSGNTLTFKTAKNLATTSTKNVTATVNSTAVTVGSTSDLSVGMLVSGTGIRPGTIIAAIPSGTSLTLSKPVAITAPTSLNFTKGSYPHQAYCNSSLGIGDNSLQAFLAGGTTSSAAVSSRTGNIASTSSTSITNISDTSDLVVGMTVTVASGNTRKIIEITSKTTLTLDGNAGSSGTAKNLTFAKPACMETSNTATDSKELYPQPSNYTAAVTYDGAPYYYIMSPMYYCKDSTYTSCQATSASPAPSGAYIVPAPYRWCTTSAYTSCQDLRNEANTVPDYLGRVISGVRSNTGKFIRVDIVPSTTSYPKAGGRKDCAGTTCTYAEELQNFANWYSYYRSRMLLMKTTSTRAFNALDSKYRVGFDLLSHYGKNSIDLEVAQFVDSGGEIANQRTQWWSNLTGTTTSGSTPLRSSLLKMGKYYAGKLTSAAAVPAKAGAKAFGSIQIKSTTKNGAKITSLMIESVSMLGTTFTVAGCGSTSCSSTQLSTQANNLLALITSSAGYAASGYTASRSGSTIYFTADTEGSAHNGDDIQVSKSGTINLSISDLAGGKDAVAAIPAVVIEPLQYSCQQNFTLLVTDGYWNSDYHDDLTQLNGTSEIKNQDDVNTGLTARPFYDGAQASATCTDDDYSSCGTLADIAMYYYKTDLRDAALGNAISGATGLDVAANNVFQSPTDSNQNQHMVLFTMGLGAPGTLRYTGDYATASTGDFKNISNGTANWPAVQANDPTTIDDLWHAAVNGRGKYFSARNPEAVVSGLGEALSSIQVREGAAAAAATSNLQPVSGDNFAYVASYTTNEWSGDLQARTINLANGDVSDPANVAPNDCVSDAGCPWSAKKKLDALAWTARNVYMASSNGSALRAFTYANLTSTEQAYFDPGTGNATYGTGPLSQYGSVHVTNPTDITATKMVDFLRGDRSLESGDPTNKPEIWRQRAHVLGDIVNTQPTFVRAPTATYQDSGYSAFVTAKASRESVVYVSGNDGMLHAFAAGDFTDGTVTGGTELWSFIPTATLPYLRYLADKGYVHRYFVDGQITVADVNFGGGASDWHTILVGGLGGGGKAYYALDITDPLNPKYLWEFTHANLGYTYGNISINKLPTGEWAVLFSSGYNNADGKGYLYALNPSNGALRSGYPITNNSGIAASPSNLGKVAAWVDNLDANNTATQVYAGDMDGDLWRFDLASQTAFKLAHLEDASGNPQPITTRPEMTLNDGTRIVYIGTGRYLGDLDPPDTSVQSFYGMADTMGAANLGGSIQVTWNPRTDTISSTPVFLQRKLIALKNDGSQITRTDTSGNVVEARQICTGASSEVSSSTGKCTNETGGAMDWTNSGGWYFDFPDAGERINVDMNLTLGTLTIPSNVPASSSCTSGGYGWVNYIDFKTGLEVDSSLIVSQKVANALIVGLNVIKIGDKLVAIVTTSDFNHDAVEPPGAPGKFKGKRDLWRELDLY